MQCLYWYSLLPWLLDDTHDNTSATFSWKQQQKHGKKRILSVCKMRLLSLLSRRRPVDVWRLMNPFQALISLDEFNCSLLDDRMSGDESCSLTLGKVKVSIRLKGNDETSVCTCFLVVAVRQICIKLCCYPRFKLKQVTDFQGYSEQKCMSISHEVFETPSLMYKNSSQLFHLLNFSSIPTWPHSVLSLSCWFSCTLPYMYTPIPGHAHMLPQVPHAPISREEWRKPHILMTCLLTRRKILGELNSFRNCCTVIFILLCHQLSTFCTIWALLRLCT